MDSRFQFATLLITAVLVSGSLDAQARGATKSPATTPTTTYTPANSAKVKSTSVDSMTASPATISFVSTDPDLSPVSGSSAATIAITLSGENHVRAWSLGIQAGSSTFTGCTTLPASAVTATCTNVVVNQISGPTIGTGACASGAGLSSSSSITVASGNEGTGSNSYTITIKFILTDSWQYIGATSPTCPLTVTYTLNAA
jgi:hypothetical protein